MLAILGARGTEIGTALGSRGTEIGTGVSTAVLAFSTVLLLLRGGVLIGIGVGSLGFGIKGSDFTFGILPPDGGGGGGISLELAGIGGVAFACI